MKQVQKLLLISFKAYNSKLENSFRCNGIIETGYVYHSITNEDVSSCNDDLQR